MCVYSRCILALTLTHYRRYSIIYLCTLRPRSTCVYSTARVIINVKTHRTIVFSKCICYSDIVERKIQRKTYYIIYAYRERDFSFSMSTIWFFLSLYRVSWSRLVLKYNIFEREKFVFRPCIICYIVYYLLYNRLTHTQHNHISNVFRLYAAADLLYIIRYSIHMSDLRILPYL